MYIIRDIFIAKPGQASKLAKMMKESMPGMPGMRVLTDLVSDYNQVVVEHEMESLSEFDQEMKEYKKETSEKKPGEMTGYHDMYYKGRREIFQTWD